MIYNPNKKRTFEEILTLLEKCYAETQGASTSARRTHGLAIEAILRDYPEANKYWKVNTDTIWWSKRYIRIEVKATTASKVKPKKKINTDNIIYYRGVKIEWKNNTRSKDNDDGEKTYFFQFFEKGQAVGCFKKIGTTVKSCLKRVKQEIYYYEKHGFNFDKVEILEIFNCGSYKAEGYESYLRSLLMVHCPNTWRKNDRFFGDTSAITVALFLELCNQYTKIRKNNAA